MFLIYLLRFKRKKKFCQENFKGVYIPPVTILDAGYINRYSILDPGFNPETRNQYPTTRIKNIQNPASRIKHLALYPLFIPVKSETGALHEVQIIIT